jgi:prepilin-type N-terminal cleavage/methylation domain-containing protein
MSPRCGHRFKRGFTLIEVLIALALSVMLAALLFSALHTYVLSASAGHKHVAARQLSESVSQFIRDQLREAVPLVLNTGGKRHILFYGDERKIACVGYIPSHRSAGGLHHNSLVISGTPPKQTLSFTYERLAVDYQYDLKAFSDVDTSGGRTLVEARLIEFEYFGTAGIRADTGWFGKWPVDDRLPELIRIRFEKTDAQSAPDIVVPIYANAATNHIALSIGQRAKSTPDGVMPGRTRAGRPRAADAGGQVPER